MYRCVIGARRCGVTDFNTGDAHRLAVPEGISVQTTAARQEIDLLERRVLAIGSSRRSRRSLCGLALPLLLVATGHVMPVRAAKAQQVGEVFQDCAVCPQMIVVPAGRFIMGSPENGGGPV